jgi:hypothetical protein
LKNETEKVVQRLKDVLQYPVVAYERVEHELSLGRIAGPFSIRPISNMRYFSKAIYNSFKLIGRYPNCHISYTFKPRPGLFNKGVRTYGEYLVKCEALHVIFITRTWSQIDGN